jgi:hypothetical protein
MTGLQHRYADPQSQAWLGLWCSLYPGSLLSKYLDPDMPKFTRPALRPILPQPPPFGKYAPRKPVRAPRAKAAKPRPATASEKRKTVREQVSLQQIELSDWAKRLMGDGRIQSITLDDIIDGIEDYFTIFSNMRRIDKPVYKYFQKTGVPLFFANSAVWTEELSAMRIANANALPSFFGAFFPKNAEQYREHVFNDDKCGMFEFQYFAKLKTHATVAPHGSTVFSHNTMSLKRDVLSREELKSFPWARRDWGFGWFVGVLPDGAVRALPCQMRRDQMLKSGDVVHHSSFEIPPGLWDLSAKNDPHDLVRRAFAAVLACTASSLSGLQVTIKKGSENARFGIPISYARAFFADREVDALSNRRKAILHLIFPHDRHMRDGRIVRVGEHLRGTRHFEWRGYEVTIGASGIHYPSPESFTGPLYDFDNPPPDVVLPNEKDTISLDEVGSRMGRIIWRKNKPRFVKGKPESEWSQPTLTEPHILQTPPTIEHEPQP